MIVSSAFPACMSPSHLPHHLPISQTRLLIAPPRIQCGEAQDERVGKLLYEWNVAPTSISAAWVSNAEPLWWGCVCLWVLPPPMGPSLAVIRSLTTGNATSGWLCGSLSGLVSSSVHFLWPPETVPFPVGPSRVPFYTIYNCNKKQAPIPLRSSGVSAYREAGPAHDNSLGASSQPQTLSMRTFKVRQWSQSVHPRNSWGCR